MSRTEQRRAAVFALYERAVTNDPERAPGEDLRPFTRELVEGVEQHAKQLDELIERHAIGWKLDRIAPLERSILRVALFEIRYRDDIPDEVAIDEAVETAKSYCGTDTPGFVNGILGAVIKEGQVR